MDGEGLDGRSEIMAAGAWVDANADGSMKATLLGLSYGKFINSNLELQGTLIYGKVSTDNDTDASAFIIAPAVAYHFIPKNASATVPYVGAGLVYATADNGDDSDTSFKPEFFAGAKFFIGGDYETAKTAAFLEYRYTNVDIGDDNANVNMLWGGLSFFF